MADRTLPPAEQLVDLLMQWQSESKLQAFFNLADRWRQYREELTRVTCSFATLREDLPEIEQEFSPGFHDRELSQQYYITLEHQGHCRTEIRRLEALIEADCLRLEDARQQFLAMETLIRSHFPSLLGQIPAVDFFGEPPGNLNEIATQLRGIEGAVRVQAATEQIDSAVKQEAPDDFLSNGTETVVGTADSPSRQCAVPVSEITNQLPPNPGKLFRFLVENGNSCRWGEIPDHCFNRGDRHNTETVGSLLKSLQTKLNTLNCPEMQARISISYANQTVTLLDYPLG